MGAAFLVAMSLAVFGLSSGNLFTPEQEAAVRDFVNVVMECRKVPGLTIAVVKGNETWTSGFGVADMATGRKVTDRDLFGIGSVGKSFTMALLAKALQEMGLNWDTKLIDIPGLDLKFTNETLTMEVTLADLLAHRTGLSPVMDNGFIAGYPDQTTRHVIVRRLRFLPEIAHARQRFLYNNVMYLVVGLVTELLTKERWEDNLATDLFEPLGMTSSKLMHHSSDALRSDAAKPYMYRDGEFQPSTTGIYRLYPLEPAGSILSNAVDMAKWMRFNLELGVTETGETILDRDMLSQAFQSHVATPLFGFIRDLRTPQFPINDLTSGYGFAWFSSSYRGYPRNWHSGGFFSYISLLWLFPNETLGVFGNVNGPATNHDPGRALQTILSYITDIALGLEPWLTPETACSFPGPWKNDTNYNIPKNNDFIAPNKADYLGSFGCRVLPNIVVTEGEDSYLSFSMGRLYGKLNPTNTEDRFNLEFTGFWEFAVEKVLSENYTVTYPVQFHRQNGNDVTGFSLTIDGTFNYTKGFDFTNDGDDDSNDDNDGDDDGISRGALVSIRIYFVILFGLISIGTMEIYI